MKLVYFRRHTCGTLFRQIAHRSAVIRNHLMMQKFKQERAVKWVVVVNPASKYAELEKKNNSSVFNGLQKIAAEIVGTRAVNCWIYHPRPFIMLINYH